MKTGQAVYPGHNQARVVRPTNRLSKNKEPGHTHRIRNKINGLIDIQ